MSSFADGIEDGITALIIVFVIGAVLITGSLGFFTIRYGVLHYGWFVPNAEQVKQRENEIYKQGATKGMLMVINYERKSEGQEPFKDWAEFEAYGDSLKNMDSFFKEIDDLRIKKERAKEQYPDKPWVKK